MSRPERRHLHQTWVRVAAGHCGRRPEPEATATTGAAELAAELLAETAALLARVEAYLRTGP